MNIHFGNQSQFELFPGTTGEPIENTAPRFIFSRIVLTFENLVVVFVFVIVCLIIAFSIGVERGRVKARLARPVAQLTMPQTTQTSVMPNAQIALVAPSVPAVKPLPLAVVNAEASLRTVPSSVRVAPALMPKPVDREKDVDKRYTVQVASYKKESMAQKESKELKRQGLASFVAVKGNYSIVCVGRFSTQEEAKQMLGKLKKRYKDSTIRSL